MKDETKVMVKLGQRKERKKIKSRVEKKGEKEQRGKRLRIHVIVKHLKVVMEEKQE